MSQQEQVWTYVVLGMAVSCALIGAVAVTMSVRDAATRYAWGWAVFFVVFSLLAAYAFWRLL